MRFGKTKHYRHVFMSDDDHQFRHKPILFVGGSGSGKSMTVAKYIENIEDNKKDVIIFYLVDEVDTIEDGFAMFPATDRMHVRRLTKYKEKPQAKNNVNLYCFHGSELKKWQQEKKKLPKMQIITFSAKDILQTEECLFLLEIDSERGTKASSLLEEAGKRLKEDEDLRFVRFYARELAESKRTSYMGMDLEIFEEPIADKTNLKDVWRVLSIFDNQDVIMQHNCKYNLKVSDLLKKGGQRHVFVYKGLAKNQKLRDFLFFHLLKEIQRNIADCKHPVIIKIEEAQDKAPISAKGYLCTSALHIGKAMGTLRKTSRGTSVLVVGRTWSKISETVKAECRQQIIFHLEQDDMTKYLKVRTLNRRQKDKMENLGTGEYIVKGKESYKIESKIPRHGHKHEHMQFLEEYKKHFPKLLTTYTDELNDLRDISLKHESAFKDRIRRFVEEQKQEIRKKRKDQASSQKQRSELTQYKEKERELRNEKKEKLYAEIIAESDRLKSSPLEKYSYRIISKNLAKKGITVSYVTVKSVIDDYTPPREEPGADVK